MTGLNIGVVGLGLGRHHVTAYAESGAAGRLVVCDQDPRRVEEVRATVPQVAAGYPDLAAMLAAEQLDAVSIVTPDHLHRPHAEQCLAAGCHVLLTKPLATNLADGAAIVQAADRADRVLMVAHERRFRARTRAIRELVQAGELGEIVHLRVDAIQDKRGQFSRSPWYASVEAGRSALVGSGIHEVDLLRYLIDRPIRSVYALSNRLGSLQFPKDKTTSALYSFAGGAIGQVTVTYEAHWPPSGAIDDHFRLVGTRGMVVGDQVARDGQSAWEPLPRDANELVAGTRGCVEAFLASLLHGAAVAVSSREAFASLAACVAADESAASGQPTVPAEYGAILNPM